MAVLKFEQARTQVIDQVRRSGRTGQVRPVPLEECHGAVLAGPVQADRDFPPFDRSTRDGFAVRADDMSQIPAQLRVLGLARAGAAFEGAVVGAGECVEIMTGAAVPPGADSVVMVEYAERQGDGVVLSRSVQPGENVVSRGAEAQQGEQLLGPGVRIGYAEVAMMAGVGMTEVPVFSKPRVAIIPTGDEVVEVSEQPGPYQIRNSNSRSLEAQVAAAYGVPVAVGIAPDREESLREMILQALDCDVLLLSGGVSAGRYDLVEPVLAGLGAEFFFDGVSIQPGRPLVFGKLKNCFIFGLPGNPLSTMVTFELFVRPALALLSGERDAPLHLLRARLGRDIHRRPGLAAFLPARLEGPMYQPVIHPVEWKGSGDVASLTRANCFLAIPESEADLKAGDWVSVLPR